MSICKHGINEECCSFCIKSKKEQEQATKKLELEKASKQKESDN